MAALIPAVCAVNCGPAVAALGASLGFVPLAAVGTLGAAGYMAYRHIKGEGEEEEEEFHSEVEQENDAKPKSSVQLYQGGDEKGDMSSGEKQALADTEPCTPNTEVSSDNCGGDGAAGLPKCSSNSIVASGNNFF